MQDRAEYHASKYFKAGESFKINPVERFQETFNQHHFSSLYKDNGEVEIKEPVISDI